MLLEHAGREAARLGGFGRRKPRKERGPGHTGFAPYLYWRNDLGKLLGKLPRLGERALTVVAEMASHKIVTSG